jgi:3-hydroxyacyl-CoA dehydrogenase
MTIDSDPGGAKGGIFAAGTVRPSRIAKVGVIGAGVMGAGIAAHVANAGVEVVLLDIVPQGSNDRSVVARGAVEALKKAQPAPFMHKRNIRRIQVGNVEDDLDALGDCDWIIEAVIERLDIKQDLYARIDTVRRADAVVSSNTSTIPLSLLTDGMSDSLREHFLVAHFFNPPRYMRLLELVVGPDTKPEVATNIADFADVALGKGVVRCNDRPGFIANRIGTYWIQNAIAAAFKHGLTVEEADAIAGRPMGVPKTGVFGLVDLIGLDLMPHILGSLKSTLPSDDPLSVGSELPPLVHRLIDEGYTGRKGKGGFYRLRRDGGKQIKEAVDLVSGEYRVAERPQPGCIRDSRNDGLRALLEHDSAGGRFARDLLLPTLAYAAALVPEIAATPAELDEGMRLGYSWQHGPFELIDRFGVDWLNTALEADGIAVPERLRQAAGSTFYRVHDGRTQCLHPDGDYRVVERAPGVFTLGDVKQASDVIARNGSASLWSIGDGVLCLEFNSKMNAIDPGILSMIDRAVDIVQDDYKALVIHNEADNFSVGANIGLLLFAANMAAYEQIEHMVASGQKTLRRLRAAPFPVVGAPAGMALGGGCEVLLHCDAVQAHAETYLGLVEVGVGLVPGWGGCTTLLTRWLNNKKRPRGPMPAIAKAFEFISTAAVSKSAVEAIDMLLLRPEDGITMNRERLLSDAKSRALAMVDGYVPAMPEPVRLPGPTGAMAMDMAVASFHKMGKATPHDVVVAGALARVLSGGDTDMIDEMELDQLYRLEREAFVGLARTPGTLARVEHMLETGKPLRN